MLPDLRLERVVLRIHLRLPRIGAYGRQVPRAAAHAKIFHDLPLNK